MDKVKTVCFTGHRFIKETAELKIKLLEVLEDLIITGTTDFYAGGAIGWDMLCESTVIHLREKYPEIKLNLILPCPAEEQTLKWNENNKLKYYEILLLANSVITCSSHYNADCMRLRNAKLVEAADCCICYYDGRVRCGTAQTLRMAQIKGIKTINIKDLVEM